MRNLKIILTIIFIIFFVCGCTALIIFAPVYSPQKEVNIKIHPKDSINKK